MSKRNGGTGRAEPADPVEEQRAPQHSVLGITAQQMQVVAGMIAIAVPIAWGILYLSGKARFAGLVQGWGLPSGLFNQSTAELLYTGYLAEGNLFTFFFAIWVPAALVVSSGLLITVLVAVLAVGRWLGRRVARHAWLQWLSAKLQPSKPVPKDPHLLEWKLLRLSELLVIYPAWTVLIIGISGLLILLGLSYLTKEQLEKGIENAHHTAALYDRADAGSCGLNACPVPPVQSILFVEQEVKRTVEGRVIMCSAEWCGVRVRGGEVVIIATKSVISIRTLGHQYLGPDAADSGGDTSQQP